MTRINLKKLRIVNPLRLGNLIYDSTMNLRLILGLSIGLGKLGDVQVPRKDS